MVFLLEPARSTASTPNFHSVCGGALSVMTVIWAQPARHIEHDAASDTAVRLAPTPRITRTPQPRPQCVDGMRSCSRKFYNRSDDTWCVSLSRNTRVALV